MKKEKLKRAFGTEKKSLKRTGRLYWRRTAFLLFLFLVLLGFIPSPARAQTATELEAILASREVTCAQAARFVLAGASIDAADAFEHAVSEGWLSGVEANEPVTLGKLSYLIMRAFDMRGGMMYALLPGPRYAYRTMVSRSYIRGASDPAMTVNGERFLLILGRVLSARGGEQ